MKWVNKRCFWTIIIFLFLVKPVQLTILKYVSKLVKQNENTVEPLCQAKGTF